MLTKVKIYGTWMLMHEFNSLRLRVFDGCLSDRHSNEWLSAVECLTRF